MCLAFAFVCEFDCFGSLAAVGCKVGEGLNLVAVENDDGHAVFGL